MARRILMLLVIAAACALLAGSARHASALATEAVATGTGGAASTVDVDATNSAIQVCPGPATHRKGC